MMMLLQETLILFLLAPAFAAAAVGRSLDTLLARSSSELPSDEQVRSAFAADNWQVADVATTAKGYRGLYAQHATATTLSNGAPKKAYYVEGDAWAQGWLHGTLSGRNGDARAICTTYVHHIILNLLDETWDEQMAAKCENWVPGQESDTNADDGEMGCETYELLLRLMDTWLIAGAVHSFQHERAKFPTELLIEMEAFVAGSNSADASSGCSWEKMVYLNYGIDYIMSALYAGQLPHVLAEQALLQNSGGGESLPNPMVTTRQIEQLRQLPAAAFRVPYFCNSFGVSNGATASGEDVFMSRDFQLPTGLVYQDVAADMIFMPTDGRLPHVSSGAPGFVGRMTVLNAAGVGMGVDMLRAAPNAPEAPGMNSIMLLRKVADTALNTSHAIDIVAATERGTTWLYPICDAEGSCATLEAGKYLPPGEPFNPLQYVDSEELKAVLPDASFFREHSSDDIFDRGLYARPMDWSYPEEYLDFNEALFDMAGVPYDASSSSWGATGYLFDDFEEENEVTKQALHNNFYPPQRETFKDMILISNNAIVPEFRTSMMSRAGNFWEVTAHAAQWRYDDINNQLTEAYGSMDMESALRITSFLSPMQTPGYWTNTINSSDPMSAIVEGTMNVMHINQRVLVTKTGYWADDWTQLCLSNFLVK